MDNGIIKQKIEYKSDQFFLPPIQDENVKRQVGFHYLPQNNQYQNGSFQDESKIPTSIKVNQSQSEKQQQKIFGALDATTHNQQTSQSQRQSLNQQGLIDQIPQPSVEEQDLIISTKIASLKTKSMVKNASSDSFAQFQQFQEIKGNVKNAYIKKITSLLNFKSVKIEQQSESEIDSSSIGEEQQIYKSLKNRGILGSTQDLLSLEKKNLKMKESAKKSRLRKKVYINMLENKIQEMEQQMQKYKSGTADVIKFIEVIVDQNDSISSLVVGQAQIEARMNLVSQRQEDQEGLQLLLDSYSMRFGVSGVKRKQYIKYCFMNLARLLLQSNYGTLLFAAGQNDNTRSEEFNNYIKEFKNICDIQDENLIYKLLTPINQILDHKKQHENLIKGLYEQINHLTKRQMQLEIVISDINQILNPWQQAILVDQFQKQTTKKSRQSIVTDEFLGIETVSDQGPYKKVCL